MQRRLDKGIWQTDYGYRVMLSINRTLHTKRFPPTYTLEQLRKWRDDH
jgi:hypothetical protein